MAEQDSIELKTVKACSVALGKTLKGADSGMVSFLEENGFITDEDRLRVIDVKNPLSAADKTNLLVEGIKDRIDLDEDSYKVLVDRFRLSGVRYEPIVKKLDKEYEKQYAAANPNMSSAAMTSGGSGGGGATAASQPKTVESQSTSKTLPAAAAAVDSRTLSIDDLGDVLGAVESLAGQWRDFSLILHLKETTLTVIEKNNSTDVRDCLRNALKEWLRWNYDLKKYGKPNWKTLAEAVSSLGDGALSETIVTAHSVREM